MIPPPSRAWRIAFATFAIVGLAPSVAALADSDGLSLTQAQREGRAVGRTLDHHGVEGPVATLSPQILPAAIRLPDPAFATGPFYFRSTTLLDAPQERALHLISRARVKLDGSTILTGGEGPATSGNASLDHALASAARDAGYDAIPIPGTRFTAFRPPARAPASPQPVPHNSP
jgi:hypothetical protein